MSRLMSVDGALLVGRQLVFECVLEFLLPVGVGTERMARNCLARGVELEQLLGHVAHGLLDPGLRPLPRGAAEPVERRPRRAGVLLDQVQPLHRHEQLVFAGVAELQKLLERVADADLLQADELADAVIDVHDEVAHLQVAQIREKRLGRRAAALRGAPLFLEDVGLGVDVERRVRQAEAAGQPADRNQHRRIAGIVGALDRHREQVVLLQQLDRSLGAACRGGDEQRRLVLFALAADLGHPIRHAAAELDRRLASDVTNPLTFLERDLREVGGVGQPGVDGRPIGKQGVWRRGRDRAAIARDRFLVAAPHGLEQFLRVRVDLVAFGDDHARFLDAGKVVEERCRPIVSKHVPQRNHGELIDGVNRPLGRWIVGAQRLDRVADELEPDRLRVARRVDIENAAADREFAVLVSRVLAGKAGFDEQLAEVGRCDVLVRTQVDGCIQQTRRRADARKEGRRRRHHHPRRSA